MSPNGKEIVSAHSLSPEWAILSTEISKAPTFASSPSATNTGAEGDKGLMLRIEGTEIISDEGVGADKISEGDMETLLGTFEKRMGDLRKVIEGGGIDGCNGREEGEG